MHLSDAVLLAIGPLGLMAAAAVAYRAVRRHS